MTWEVLNSVSSSANWWDWILTIINFIVNAVVFLWNSILTIFSWIWKLAQDILSGFLFGYINDAFNYLSVYLGTAYAGIFMWLFWLVFLIVIFGLVFRLLRGRVNYDSTLKKYNKNHPSK